MKINKTNILITRQGLSEPVDITVNMEDVLAAPGEVIREETYKVLILAQEKKTRSLCFSFLGFIEKEPGWAVVSKLMAQEIFRYFRNFAEPVLEKIIFVLADDIAYNIFNKNVCSYLEYTNKKISQGPFVTVDGIVQYHGGIVLIERSNPPFGWALPGGFVDYGESVEEAVAREINEETSLNFKDFRQFKVYSSPDRDPRFHTVSVVFSGKGEGRLCAADDAKNAAVFSLDALPQDIAFDHRRIIEEFFKF